MDPKQKLRRTRGPGQDSNPGSNADQFLISLPLSKMCGTPKKVPKVSASLDPSFGPKNHLCFASRFIGSAEDANRDYFCGPGDANGAPFASSADPSADPSADLATQTVPLLRPRRTRPWKTKLHFADAMASEDPGPSASGAVFLSAGIVSMGL